VSEEDVARRPASTGSSDGPTTKARPEQMVDDRFEIVASAVRSVSTSSTARVR